MHFKLSAAPLESICSALQTACGRFKDYFGLRTPRVGSDASKHILSQVWTRFWGKEFKQTKPDFPLFEFVRIETGSFCGVFSSPADEKCGLLCPFFSSLDNEKNCFVFMLCCRKGIRGSSGRRRPTLPARRDTFTPSETSATSREPLMSRIVISPERR